MRCTMILMLFLLSATAAAADATAQQQPLAISAITAQQNQIRAEVQAGTGPYQTMPVQRRNELLSRQQKVLGILDGKRSADELTESERNEVSSDLEWITATTNSARDSARDEHVICKTQRTLGSNRLERVCRTAAQMDEDRESARRSMDMRCGSAACSN